MRIIAHVARPVLHTSHPHNTYTWTYIHACKHTYISPSTFTPSNSHMHIQPENAHTCTRIYIYIHICTNIQSNDAFTTYLSFHFIFFLNTWTLSWTSTCAYIMFPMQDKVAQREITLPLVADYCFVGSLSIWLYKLKGGGPWCTYNQYWRASLRTVFKTNVWKSFMTKCRILTLIQKGCERCHFIGREVFFNLQVIANQSWAPVSRNCVLFLFIPLHNRPPLNQFLLMCKLFSAHCDLKAMGII